LKTIVSYRSSLGLSVAAALIGLGLMVMTAEQRVVAAPALVCLFALLWLWLKLWDRDQKVPFLDVGIFCAVVTAIYAIYPLANYWIGGFEFNILSDSRLYSHKPAPLDLFYFHLRHVIYLFAFVIAYAAFRGRGSVATGEIKRPPRAIRQVILVCFVLLTGYFGLLYIMTGVNFNASYAQDEFLSSASALRNLPVLLRQISVKLWGILFVFKLALLCIVVSKTVKMPWLLLLIAWIAAEVAQTVIVGGARTDLILFLVAAGLLYQRMIKALSIKSLVVSAMSIFTLFMMLGFYRTYLDIYSLQSGLWTSEGGLLSRGNEFQSLLGTAYDVLQRKEAGADLPWYLYINDAMAILPPQQIMPFEKVAASEWYLREIGLSGTGIGLMWGVIAQSIVGLDWFELVLRGVVLGLVLAQVHRWYLRHQQGFMETLFYVYICLKVYNTFRNTTFSLLGNIIWEFMPFYIFVKAWEVCLPCKRKMARVTVEGVTVR
jgi:hypothetical protein